MRPRPVVTLLSLAAVVMLLAVTAADARRPRHVTGAPARPAAPQLRLAAAGRVLARAGGAFTAAGDATAAGAESVDPIALHEPDHATAGGDIPIGLEDRSATGGDAYTLCLTPPLGRASCRRGTLGRGGRTIQWPAPRPGRWAISLHAGVIGARGGLDVSPAGGHLTVLAAGDSEMQILDDDIAGDLGGGVTVDGDARQSTGLEGELNFDWQQEAAKDVSSDAPDVTVMMIGANDGYAIQGAPCCGADWSRLYAGQVAQLTRTLLQGTKGIVYWVLLPAPTPGQFAPVFTGVDEGIRAAVAQFPGRTAVIDANRFFTPGNRYRDEMTSGGRSFAIHEPDGVHLSADADSVLAQLIARRLSSDGVIPAGG